MNRRKLLGMFGGAAAIGVVGTGHLTAQEDAPVTKSPGVDVAARMDEMAQYWQERDSLITQVRNTTWPDFHRESGMGGVYHIRRPKA